eukprot:NODE_5233_length_1044_cov_84.019544_g4672_i0.p1 GENE.NODE_5233_length_1044_cov_84.019544_g4672_i0~~NODE_5233_length_1044_cov_84.019544_g4672_i0.p1  ORF type:complete len:257 (-),score=51.36 NODE_5233_length_1044_cov_84.019544_g4672_i0:221-991(-)
MSGFEGAAKSKQVEEDSIQGVSAKIKKLGVKLKQLQNCIDEFATQDSPAIRTRMNKLKDELVTSRQEIDKSLNVLKKEALAPIEKNSLEKLMTSYTADCKKLDEMLKELKKVELKKPAQLTETSDERKQGGQGGLQQFDEKKLVPQYDDGALTTEKAIQKEKNLGIRQLEEELRELNTAYREFNEVVGEQQKDVDRLGQNVREANLNIEEGTSELKQAGTYQKAARKKMCIILILSLVVIAVCLAILFPTVFLKKK